MPETKIAKFFEPAAPNRQLVEEHHIDPVIFPFDLFQFDSERSEGYDLPGIIALDGYLEIPVTGVAFTGLTAGENLSARDVVCLNASAQVIKADKGTATKVNCIGFSATAVTSGYAVRVVTAGKLVGFAGLTPKEPVFLDDLGAITQSLSGFSDSDYVVPLGTALSATEIEVQVGAAIAYDKYNSPTYTELQGGYIEGGGTKTPTPPTITVCKPVGKGAILIEWGRQLNLTNFDHYEIQVSSDDATWYSLEFDGSDWKDILNGDTDVDVERVVHPNIPHTGTADNPAGRTLYYRVRTAIKSGSPSGWSTSATATTNVVSAGDLAANSIYANNILAATIQTMMMRASAAWLGYDGSGTYTAPDEGDRRIYIDGDEIKYQIYTDGAWTDERQITLGGVDGDGNFRPFVACSGMTADADNIPDFDPLPNQSYYLFRLDNSLEDVDEVGSLTGAIGPVYTTSSKFGTHAVEDSSLLTFGFLTNPYDEGEDFTLSIWYYHFQQTMGSDIIYVGDASDGFDVEMRSSSPWNVIQCNTRKGGTTSTLTGPTLTTGWHHIAITYDSTNNYTYFIVDDEIYSHQPTGTWGAGSGACDIQVLLTDCRVDDYAVSFRHFCEPDYLVQHGNRGVQWESCTILSRNDLYLRSKTDGMVRAYDSPKRMLRHDFQSITTTGDKLDELTATLEPGGYYYRYSLIVQSDNLGCGMSFGVNFTGSVDNFIAKASWICGSAAGAITTLEDEISATTVHVNSVQQTLTETTTAPNLNGILAVATVDTDSLITIEGILFVTVGGDLELWWASELAAQAVRIYEGSGLVVDKLGPADI